MKRIRVTSNGLSFRRWIACQDVTTGKDTPRISRKSCKRAKNVQSTGEDDLLEHPCRKMKPEGTVVLAHPP